MRGIYTAGVLDVLLEQNIHFDGVIGVSAGAIHGASYVSEQQGRSIRYYTKYCRDKHFMSLYSLLTTGSLVGEQFCYHDIPEKLDPFDSGTFSRSRTKFYVTCTNLETGRAEYIRIRDMAKGLPYFLASASMPYVSRTVEAGGRKLLDGGIADSIPLQAFERRGYEKNLVILTRPEGYQKKRRRFSFAKAVYGAYPNFIRTLRRRPGRYNAELDYVQRQADAGHAFLLRPSADLHIGRMERDPRRLREMYCLGRKDAEASLPQLRHFLAD